jgi:hypothetical protein
MPEALAPATLLLKPPRASRALESAAFAAGPPLDFHFLVGRPIHMADDRIRSRQQERTTLFAAAVPARRNACTAPHYYSTPWCGPTGRRYCSWHSAASRRAIIHSLRARSPWFTVHLGFNRRLTFCRPTNPRRYDPATRKAPWGAV